MPQPVKSDILAPEIPMYLKKIELAGFKSFAEATTLEFPPPEKGKFSITAVVGPNGSGKSNVADAIRWVMGEQSLKQLRGKKSEDVIFGGAEGKGKMSVASVFITLDNTNRRADVDYEELVISRRVYRSGESEYSINGNQVRLLDLQLLLAQAQFGQGSYSVIGQGMITQLLTQSAAERKAFFDEAVGIKEFQIKRHQAVLKLNRTGQNIDQADMLMAEVEPRMKSLRRQVKKLEQRKELEIVQREMQEQYYATVHKQLSDNIIVLSEQTDEFTKVYTQKDAELQKTQEELAGFAKEASQQEQFQHLQAELQTLTQGRNELERDRAVLTGKLHTEYSKVGKQNVGWLENKISQVTEQKQSVGIEVQNYKKQIKASLVKMQELSHELSEKEQQKIQLQRSMVEMERRLIDASQTERVLPRSGMRAVEAILNNDKSFGGDVYGMVAELGRVDKKYQQALEVAAGFHLTSIVVENDAVASRCIAYLKEHQLGIATFLPLNKVKPRPMPHNIDVLVNNRGVAGFAKDLVEYDEKFENVFSYTFGSTLVVDDVQTARELGIGRTRMVTLDGDMLSAGGSMKGGFRKKAQYRIGFSSDAKHMLSGSQVSEEDLKKLRDELAAVETQLTTIQDDLRKAQTEKELAEHKRELVAAQEHELIKEASQFQQELSLHQLAPAEYDDMMKKLNTQKEKIEKEMSEMDKQIAEVQKSIQDFNEEQEQKRKRIFALQDAMQGIQAELNDIGVKRSAVQMDLVKQETKREDLEDEMFHELKTAIEPLLKRITSYYKESELDSVKLEIEKTKYKLSLIGGIDEEVLQEYEETKHKYERLVDELDDLKKASADLEKLIVELDAVMKKRHQVAFKKIKKEFARYFSILFEGGKAELVEVFGDDQQSAISNQQSEGENLAVIDEDEEEKPKKRKKKILQGIDVVACPPGKKIKHIAALSGGERTMTSIALVCAILHTNPPPFVLLDEVEAALDEANTVRFTKILHELSEQSQFILITHNRATMHAADVLYGVTMGNDGVSKLVSVGLKDSVVSIQ